MIFIHSLAFCLIPSLLPFHTRSLMPSLLLLACTSCAFCVRRDLHDPFRLLHESPLWKAFLRFPEKKEKGIRIPPPASQPPRRSSCCRRSCCIDSKPQIMKEGRKLEVALHALRMKSSSSCDEMMIPDPEIEASSLSPYPDDRACESRLLRPKASSSLLLSSCVLHSDPVISHLLPG